MSQTNEQGFNHYGFREARSERLSSCYVKVSEYCGKYNSVNSSADPNVHFANVQISQYNKKTEGYDQVNFNLSDLKLLRDVLPSLIAKVGELNGHEST